MAIRRVITQNLIDDLDGSTADVSFTITLNQRRYRLDLSQTNFDEWIAPLLAVSNNPTTDRRLKQNKAEAESRPAKMTKQQAASVAGKARWAKVRAANDGVAVSANKNSGSQAKSAAAKVGWANEQNLFGQLPQSERIALRRWLNRPAGRVSDKEVRQWTGEDT
jgi:Lsr2